MEIRCGGINEDLSKKSINDFNVYLENKATGRRIRSRTTRCSYDPTTKENKI